MNQRRYDIDALRSIAMFLLIFYHLGISFTSLAKQAFYIQNKRVMDGDMAITKPNEQLENSTSFLNCRDCFKAFIQKENEDTNF